MLSIARRVVVAGLVTVLPVVACYSVTASANDDAAEAIFNRVIRPILTGKCSTCHGPDDNKREADLRLDVRADALLDRGGYRAIAPGNPDESELITRVTSDDEDLRMPPGPAAQGLTEDEVASLRRWIAEGAVYEEHWSLIPPQRPVPPEVTDASWPRNAIDYFVMSRLDKKGLAPSADAEPRTLLRRLSFDLTGLPPTREQVERFSSDPSQLAYEREAEHLLASKHFGERLALYWLDVVRYADTGGYHSDNHRDISPYRDYVIRAFNENLPFDQFTVEQIAGDLLPDAARQQKIASGYNRLLQTTEEGGAQPKEYTAKYQADRVRNTAAAWLGITMGCCECHNHKFDPFSIRDFYSFAAFFADLQEKPVGRQDQTRLPTAEQEQQLAELRGELAPLEDRYAATTPEFEAARVDWVWKRQQQLSGQPPPADLPAAVGDAIRLPDEQRTAKQRALVAEHYRGIAPQLAGLRAQIADLQRRIAAIDKQVTLTLISVSAKPRTVRILARGNWQDDSGEEVGPATPEVLARASFQDRQSARLGLARWMVARDNPLVARVFVNRLWKLFYGEGIVRSLADFGMQGQWPTHPQLLDWLAVEFIESGWDVKHVVKLMVQSRTYQQSSEMDAELAEVDPSNRWLARQSRFRLEAEMVRDNALAVSGLLSRKIGGPSVKPYQPAGYWQHLNFPKRTWQQDQGEDLYRRGLYTYWQRSFLHPSLSAFDAPSREECTVDRPRSNTPLQALVLLNDPTYIEAARALAARVLREGGASTNSRLSQAFKLALNRAPTARETQVLEELHAKHHRQYLDDQPQAEQLLAVGQWVTSDDLENADLAAWTSVARVILNMHETITRY